MEVQYQTDGPPNARKKRWQSATFAGFFSSDLKVFCLLKDLC